MPKQKFTITGVNANGKFIRVFAFTRQQANTIINIMVSAGMVGVHGTYHRVGKKISMMFINADGTREVLKLGLCTREKMDTYNENVKFYGALLR